MKYDNTSQAKDIYSPFFPDTQTIDFCEAFRREWKGYELHYKGTNTVSKYLYHRLKPKHNTLNEYYIFLLWLCLCVDREWMNIMPPNMNDLIKLPPAITERFRINDKTLAKAEEIRIREMSNGKYNVPELPVPDTSTMIKRLNNMKTLQAILYIPIHEHFKKILPQLTSHFMILSKFGELIKKEKVLRKRDLMRKMHINKAQTDHLIDLMDDYIIIKNQFHSTWIYWNTEKTEG